MFLNSSSAGQNFLRLRDAYDVQLRPSKIKGRPWIKLLGKSDSSFARMCRALLSHALIGSYYKQLNIQSDTTCEWGRPDYIREHILNVCDKVFRLFDVPPRSMSGFLEFLERNPSAFAFHSPPLDEG